jgi:phosphopantothenate-cysteine ligase
MALGAGLNVLVTAGGTSEHIDEVRSITNTSTGRLGSLIAEAFDREGEVGGIWYVCGARAARPDAGKAVVRPVGSAADLAAAVADICSGGRIDVVVHSMAVSDYTVGAVTTAGAIADSVAAGLAGRAAEGAGPREAALAAVRGARPFGHGGKIPSDVEDLVIFMKRTPKIISMYRGLLPAATLVGFKLLDGAGLDALMAAAGQLLERNGCDFVLANDLREIGEGRHVGHLLRRGGGWETFTTKEEIAAGIVRAALGPGRRPGGGRA